MRKALWLLASVGAQGLAIPAVAQTAEQPADQTQSADQEDSGEVQAIVVTGSRIDRAGFTAPTPTVVVIVKPQVDPPAAAYRDGVGVVIVSIVRNHPGTVNPMIKSNNLMNSALAGQEAYRRGAFEGIMRNYRGELAECTTANLFIVKDGVALTPPIDAGLLPGITREFLFEVGRDVGVDVREQVLHDADLLGADEAFLTSTTREAVPITTVDGRPIGTGRPGPVTARLLDGFRRRAGKE